MLDSDEADLLVDICEFASSGTWNQLCTYLRERGWTSEQLQSAGEQIADIADRDNPFEDGYDS